MATAQCIATQASFGWGNFLWGRITTKWRNLHECVTQAKSKMQSLTWAKKLINILWNYIDSLWKHRNSVIHGKDKEEAAALDRDQHNDRIHTEYQLCQQDSFVIP
jgi:hypothetical protein